MAEKISLIVRWIWRTFLFLLVLLTLLILIIQVPFIQNYLVSKATSVFKERIGIDVSVERVSLDYLTRLHLEGLLVKDYQGDTMIFVANLEDKYLFEYHDGIQFNNKKLVIDGAQIYLSNNRKDSVLNITHTFRSKSAKSEDTATQRQNAKKSNFRFVLNEVDLKHVKLTFRDSYNYKRILVNLDRLKIDADDMNVGMKPWEIKKLVISKPKVQLVDEVGPYYPIDLKPEYLALPFNTNIKELELVDGELRVQDERVLVKPKSGLLNFSDLHASNLSLKAKDVQLRKPSIKGNVISFRAIEKSGLKILGLQTNFYMNSFKTEAKDLVFKTEFSTLKGYLRFDYKHMREYLAFARRVQVTSSLAQSNIDIRDLAYFSESLNPFRHFNLAFSTRGNGTMNALKLTQLVAKTNQGRMDIVGDVFVQDLFIPGKLQIVSNLKKLNFDKKDIDFVFHKNLPAEVNNLGRINYSGTFIGSPQIFTLNGTLDSKQGQADLNQLKLDLTNIQNIQYNGNIALSNFKLASVTPGFDAIQSITTDLEVHGQGFDIATLGSTVKGKITHMHLKSDHYQNIEINGSISNKIFNGTINSLDPTLNFIANGKINLQNAKSADIDLNLDLRNIDLQKLKWTKKRQFFNARIEAIGSGKTIDDITGTMFVKDMYVLDNSSGTNVRHDFSSLTIEKELLENGTQSIDISSEEVQARLVGRYQTKEIPKLLKEYVINYFVPGNMEVAKSYKNTYFYLSADLKDIRSYAKLLYPELKNVSQGSIMCRFDGTHDKMSIDGNLKGLIWNQFRVPLLNLKHSSDIQGVDASLKMDSVYFQGKLAITPMVARITNVSDGVKLTVELLERQDEKFVDFNTIIRKKDQLVEFSILPFNSYFGKKVWTIDPDNTVQINMKDKTLFAKNIVLKKDRQQIDIGTNPENNLLKIKFDDVKLEELISGFMPILKSFKGELTGEVEIANAITKPTPIGNLRISSIEFDNQRIGDLILNSSFEDEILRSKLTLSGERIAMNANGVFDANQGVDSLHAMIQINRINPNFMNTYFKDLIYGMEGNLRANILLDGKINQLSSSGNVYIDTLSTYVNNIHTRYTTSKQTISIIPDKFVFNDFEFRDEFGNPAVANGIISHNYFQNFFLNISASTPKLFCLNTTSQNNQYFYGRVFAAADMNFKGTIGDRITISANGSNLPNSHIYIAFGGNKNADKYSFYDFISKTSSSDSSLNTKRVRRGGVNFDFNFDINDKGNLTIIMDPAVDDRIDCTGEGKISFKMSPETDMDIYGSYVVNSGNYKFTYQNLIERTFYINKGGSMQFFGDPFKSKIDLSATFKTRATAQDLVLAYYGNALDDNIRNAARNQVKVDVTLFLKNQMIQPDISYKLNIQQNDPTILAAFETITAMTERNENEMNKQVLSLLSMQRFLPPTFTGFENTNASSSSFGNDVANAGLDVISGKLSSYITDFMQNTFKGLNFDLGLQRYSQVDRTVTAGNLRNNLKLALSQKLLNDRLIFNLGGNYDFGRDATTNSNTAFFGSDVDLEYLLSRQGNLRLKVYSTLNNDPFNAKYINKTGAGIQYQKDFETLDKLFEKKK